jgi:tetratricopeptide (TPR) repeat protein
VAASVKAKVQNIEPAVKSFTIGFDHLTNNDGHLVFSWAKTMVSVKIEVPTAKIAGESITSALEGPSARDYYSAAKYYREEGQNLDQAKEWIERAVKMAGDEAFWMIREKALIYAEMGDYKKAIEAAQMSKKSAEAQGNQAYVRMNDESIKMWTKMK